MNYQEKRNKTRFILLILLSLVTVSYYWYSNRPADAVNADAFRIADLTAIDEVILEKDNEQVVLKYDGVRWTVNGALADRNLIDVLFATLQQSKALRPVAASFKDSVTADLLRSGVKVRLLAEGKTQLSFLGGGDLRKTKAYFQKENENTIYMMTIPGYRVYVSGIFELDQKGWRDKHVFQLNWRNFAGLQVRYPQSINDNFDVAFIQNYFSIDEMISVDTTKLNDFLDAISFLTVDGYDDATEQTDTSRSTDFHVLFSAKDVGGKEYSLGLYTWHSEDTVIRGIINSTQPAFFDRKRLEPILKKRDFFIGKH